MRRFSSIGLVALVAVIGLTVAACGGSSSKSSSPPPAPPPAPQPQPPAPQPPPPAQPPAPQPPPPAAPPASTPDLSKFATSGNCKSFAEFGQKISQAFTGGGDLKSEADALHKFADAAPADIKGDFQTIAAFFDKVVAAVGNLKAGETPSADSLSKLQGLQTDSAKVTAAGQHISTWVAQNCHA